MTRFPLLFLINIVQAFVYVQYAMHSATRSIHLNLFAYKPPKTEIAIIPQDSKFDAIIQP